ncbi:uncharacterized protein LOC143920416 [Arctopsyche grandis]|uniref:uncharacterized protein LOC143920416 n=1 Tax=Arctopsyche grandis TaxID=121162 RepID=UPI00406D66DD
MVKLVIILTVLLHFSMVNCCNHKDLRRIRSLVDHLVHGIKPEENTRPTYGFDLVPIQSEGTDCRSGGLLRHRSCLSDILCGSPRDKSNYEEYVGGFLTNQDNPSYPEGEFRSGLNNHHYPEPKLYAPYNQPMIHHIQ